MRTFLKGLIVIGAFLLLGAAGASDNSSILFGEILFRIFISLTLIAVGYYGQKYINIKQKRVLKIIRRNKAEFRHAA